MDAMIDYVRVPEALHLGTPTEKKETSQPIDLTAKAERTRVRDLMTSEVITLEKEQALPLAQELMRMLHIRNLPVVDDKGNFVGLVTQQSLLAAQVELLSEMSGGDPVERELSIPVARVMTTAVTTVSPDTFAVDALELMIEKKESSFPVIEDHKVVGIVTVKDFLALALANLRAGEGEQAASLHSADAPTLARSRWSSPVFHRWITILLLAAILVLISILVVREFNGSAVAGSAKPGVAAPASEVKSQATSITPAKSDRSTTTETTPAPAGRTQSIKSPRESRGARSNPNESNNQSLGTQRNDANPPSRWVPENIPTRPNL
jgi:CBS domain-containing protein